jgi:anthranilate phosphoribosyltransferase
MKDILNRLYNHQTLTQKTAREVLINIAESKYYASQVASFMSVYLMRPITVEELSGFRDAMLELCLPVKFNTHETIDIVGTGGDGKNTFNISTLACFVVAGAGYKVTKHGNYGVSSISGSSNLLESVGYKFTNNSGILQQQLDNANLCFLHAPLFHPAMKTVAPIRKELGVRTFFNMLGPLVNPCMPNYQVLGVYNLEMLRLYNYTLQQTDINYSIVHSLDGYDEISLTDTYKITGKDGERLMYPLKKILPKDLYGGNSTADATKIFLNILNGEGTEAQKSVAVINAAHAIQCFTKNNITECIAQAEDSLLSKKALLTFKKIIS